MILVRASNELTQTTGTGNRIGREFPRIENVGIWFGMASPDLGPVSGKITFLVSAGEMTRIIFYFSLLLTFLGVGKDWIYTFSICIYTYLLIYSCKSLKIYGLTQNIILVESKAPKSIDLKTLQISILILTLNQVFCLHMTYSCIM